MTLSTIIFIFELLGTVSFAIAGSMTAMAKRTDLFGVLFLGVVSATGGGVFRDILLGSFPPTAFLDSTYVALAAAVSLLMFLLARRHQDAYLANAPTVDAVNNIFDAIGLGAFTVTGVQIAVSAGYGDNLFFAAFLGSVTGTGGGLLRDIIANEIPFVLTKHIYAVASILGGVVYWLLLRLGVETAVAAVITVLAVFGLRMLATHFRWNLPRAL